MDTEDKARQYAQECAEYHNLSEDMKNLIFTAYVLGYGECKDAQEVLLKMNTTELSKTLHMAFNTVKKHMNILKECGIFAPSTIALATIVNVKKLGQEIFFIQQRQDALEKAQNDQNQEVKALKKEVYYLKAVVKQLEQERQQEKNKNTVMYY